MFRFGKLLFGPAGIPHEAKRRGCKSSLESIKVVKEIGLDVMEMEFVRGIWMNEELARKVNSESKELDLVLTSHAPYYVNFASEDDKKVNDSVKRVLDTAYITYVAGGFSTTFHAAYYRGEPSDTYDIVKEKLNYIIEELESKGVKIWIRPETTGKITQFGSIEELINLSKEFDLVLPCVDFAHIHARTKGSFNSYDEVCEILEKMESELGSESLKNFHAHISGIDYGEKGEIRHLNLRDSDLNYEAIIRALKEFDVEGVVISESPNKEEDALLLKEVYESL
ncbi:MAG: TIM barrel protein [Candidatus Asgardarchaeia archaeon]